MDDIISWEDNINVLCHFLNILKTYLSKNNLLNLLKTCEYYLDYFLFRRFHNR